MTTTDDPFGRDLERWLREEGEHRVPDHLTEVLVRTVATRQRPWWSSPERWLPMDTVATQRGMHLRPLAVVLVLAALTLGVVGAAYVASRPPSDVSFGLAQNGRVYVPTGAGILSYAPDGTDQQPFLQESGGVGYLSVSPDGSRIAYWAGPDPGHLNVAALAGGEPVEVAMPAGIDAGDQVAWSPDSSRIAFPAFRNGEEFLFTAAADGTGAMRVGGDLIPSTTAIYWPAFSPDGQWIAFLGIPDGAGKPAAPGELYLVHPDGSDLHSVAVGVHPDGNSNGWWSPDPAHPRLLFARNGVELFDLTTKRITTLGLGFWASWSPDGKRIAAWQDGIVVVDPDAAPFTSDEYVRAFPRFTGACADHPELAGKAVCSTVTWSPDGTRLIGTDIGQRGMLSVPADGQGAPILLGAPGSESAAWQPVR